jgi:hypothetical protein
MFVIAVMGLSSKNCGQKTQLFSLNTQHGVAIGAPVWPADLP